MEKKNQFCDMEKGCEMNPEFDLPCDGLETDLGNSKQAQNPSIIFYAIYRLERNFEQLGFENSQILDGL